VKAPPRIAKPPVAKKPNITPRTGPNAPKLPQTPDENAYQVPNPAAEDPYRNAYDHAQMAAKTPEVLSPDDMDDIMFDANAEAHVPYDNPQNNAPALARETYDKPSIKLRPVANFGDDMEEIMRDISSV
jgi:hypothetical protein